MNIDNRRLPLPLADGLPAFDGDKAVMLTYLALANLGATADIPVRVAIGGQATRPFLGMTGPSANHALGRAIKSGHVRKVATRTWTLPTLERPLHLPAPFDRGASAFGGQSDAFLFALALYNLGAAADKEVHMSAGHSTILSWLNRSRPSAYLARDRAVASGLVARRAVDRFSLPEVRPA